MKITMKNKKRFFLVLILILPFLFAFSPQEARVNQSKIERNLKRKDKEAEKYYLQAKKNHQKIQSKETKAMMRKSRKQSKQNTPMRPPGGKKCK